MKQQSFWWLVSVTVVGGVILMMISGGWHAAFSGDESSVATSSHAAAPPSPLIEAPTFASSPSASSPSSAIQSAQVSSAPTEPFTAQVNQRQKLTNEEYVDISTVDVDPSSALITVHFDEHGNGNTSSPLNACLFWQDSHLPPFPPNYSRNQPGVEVAGSMEFKMEGDRRGDYSFSMDCNTGWQPIIRLFTY